MYFNDRDLYTNLTFCLSLQASIAILNTLASWKGLYNKQAYQEAKSNDF
jgi:hypothetical protein